MSTPETAVPETQKPVIPTKETFSHFIFPFSNPTRNLFCPQSAFKSSVCVAGSEPPGLELFNWSSSDSNYFFTYICYCLWYHF